MFADNGDTAPEFAHMLQMLCCNRMDQTTTTQQQQQLQIISQQIFSCITTKPKVGSPKKKLPESSGRSFFPLLLPGKTDVTNLSCITTKPKIGSSKKELPETTCWSFFSLLLPGKTNVTKIQRENLWTYSLLNSSMARESPLLMAFSKGGGRGMGRRSFGGFFSSSIIHFFWHCGIWIGKLHVWIPTNPLRETGEDFVLVSRI